jgi:hypothetical protein
VKTKFLAVITCLLLAGAVISATTLVEPATSETTNTPLDLELIDDLDKVIQQRFLTVPMVGIRRLGPNPNPHLEYFEPQTDAERQAVNNLQNGQWKVGIYLIGRRAHQKSSNVGIDPEQGLLVEYRLNAPVLVTKNVKKRELANPKRLRDGVDEAFEKFKETDSYDFTQGKWSYVFRPVRARESCMQCHTGFFVTSKLGEKKYAYRSRRVGDPIGVLVYAVAKKG